MLSSTINTINFSPLMVSNKINKIVIIIQSVKYTTYIIRNIILFTEIHLVPMHFLIFQTTKNQNKKQNKRMDT